MNNHNIDTAGILCEFLEVVIHNLLFHRKLYPDGIFSLKKKYGVPVHISKHPELNKYISKTLCGIKQLLSIEKLKEVNVCFLKESVLIERFVFRLNEQSINFQEDSNESSLHQLKESLRAFCLKLSVNSSFLKPLPEKSTFKIVVHATEDSCFSDPNFQEFPWVEVQEKNVLMKDPLVVPVRNIETDLINMKIHLEANEMSK